VVAADPVVAFIVRSTALRSASATPVSAASLPTAGGSWGESLI
jgi:hypothetical protein